jgi:hypothetical protein
MTTDNTTEEQELTGEVMDLSTWERKFELLAAETDQGQIRLPTQLKGKRVNREEIAMAFLTSFEMVGGVPRLALWADANYTEFAKILGRLLPKESLVVHDGELVVKHAIQPSKLDDLPDGD